MAEASSAQPAQQKRPKQGRSPAYPGIDLKDAIAKVTALYEAEGRYAAPMALAFKAWGYGSKSSGARVVRAALRYFGLIAIEGDSEVGKVKLTDAAMRIILDQRDDQSEKKALIRRLALAPPAFKKLVERFPEGIKSDGNAEHFLVFEEKFNKSAASELLANFKATADFAELFQAPIPEEQPEVSVEQQQNEVTPVPVARSPAPHIATSKQATGERLVFSEEGAPNQYLKLIACGEMDSFLLEALEDFVKRQKKRLGTQTS